MIAQELEVSLHMAFMEARQKRHEFITVEHLLLALLDNPSASEVLRACAADIDELRKLLTEFVTEHTPILSGEDVDTQPTLGFQRVIQRAILHVQSSGKKEVTGANVLVAIFGEKDSHAVYFLHQKGVTRLDVVNFISHGITKVPQAQQASKTEHETETEQEASARRRAGELHAESQLAGALRQDRSADRARAASSSAWCRRCAAAARTTRCWWAKRAWARPRSPRASPGASSKANVPGDPQAAATSTRSTWARCSPAPSTAAISSSG